MQIGATVAMLYAQAGYTGRVAHDASEGPQAALAMTRLVAEELTKLENTQVQKTEPAMESKIKNEKDSDNGRNSFGSRRRQRSTLKENTEDEQPKGDLSPFTGNFLNIKV